MKKDMFIFGTIILGIVLICIGNFMIFSTQKDSNIIETVNAYREIEGLSLGRSIDSKDIKLLPVNGNTISNIEYINAFYSNDKNEINLVLKNNNKYPVALDLYFNYYDSNNFKIDYRSVSIKEVKANSIVVCSINLYKIPQFSGYTFTYKASDVKKNIIQYNLNKDKVVNKDNTFTVTNPFDNNLNVHLSILYYRNKKLVYADDLDIYDIEVKDNKKNSIDNKKLVTISYDRLEYIISSAYYEEK